MNSHANRKLDAWTSQTHRVTVSGKHHQQNIELQGSVTDRRDGGQGGGGG